MKNSDKRGFENYSLIKKNKMKSKDELRKSFENGDIPKQEEFWDWQDSYWHKDEKLPADKIDYDFSKKADLVDGKVPASQLPSYVDDVLEFDSFNNLPSQGEKGKIYVVTDKNNQYRWSGKEYIQTNLGDLASKLIPYTGATQNVNLNGKNLATSGVISASAFNNSAHTLSVKSFFIAGSNPTSIGIKLTHLGTSNMMGSFTVTLFGYTGQTLSFRVTMYKYNFNWYVPTITWIHGDSAKISNVEFYKEDDANLHIKVNAVTNFGAYSKTSITDVLVNPGDPLQSPDIYTLSINPDNSAHTLVQTTSLAGIVRDNYLVPYTGANKNVDLGTNVITANGLRVGNKAAATGIGISLYGGAAPGGSGVLPIYGLAYAGTATFGKHGAITDSWATYFTDSLTNRGWIFKVGTGLTGNVASISGSGTITGNYFIKSGGTATQFLKADGSVDNNTYVTQSWINSQNYATTTFVRESINDIALEITDPDYIISVKNKFITIIITEEFPNEKIDWEEFYPEQYITVINTGINTINLNLQGNSFDKISQRETSEYYVNKDRKLIKKGNFKETAFIA